MLFDLEDNSDGTYSLITSMGRNTLKIIRDFFQRREQCMPLTIQSVDSPCWKGKSTYSYSIKRQKLHAYFKENRPYEILKLQLCVRTCYLLKLCWMSEEWKREKERIQEWSKELHTIKCDCCVRLGGVVLQICCVCSRVDFISVK